MKMLYSSVLAMATLLIEVASVRADTDIPLKDERLEVLLARFENTQNQNDELADGVRILQEKVRYLEQQNEMIILRMNQLEKENREKDSLIQILGDRTEELERRVHTIENKQGGVHLPLYEKMSNLDKADNDFNKTVEQHAEEIATERTAVSDISMMEEGTEDDMTHTGYKREFVRHYRATSDGVQLPVVAFYATVTKPFIANLGQGQTIVFDHAYTNLGNAYHTFHGIFTAPYDGLYMFSATVAGDFSDHAIYVSFVLNGVTVARTRCERWDMASHTLFLVLHRGDDVSLQSDGNMGTSHILGQQYSSFGGQLVAFLE